MVVNSFRLLRRRMFSVRQDSYQMELGVFHRLVHPLVPRLREVGVLLPT